METIPVNYLAVLAAAIGNMVLGFLWYGPLFGKAWSELMGWGNMTAEQIKEKQKSMTSGYVISFVGALLMAFVLSHTLPFASAYTQTYGAAAGLMAGFWSWLGFVVPVSIGSVVWDGKPWKLWFINAGYYLAALLGMGAILALWV